MLAEKKLTAAGFHKIEEKEDCIYFGKSIMSHPEHVQQICLVYNTKKRKIQSIDTFCFQNDTFLVTGSDQQTKQSLSFLLT